MKHLFVPITYFFYILFLRTYFFYARVASLFNDKAKKWVQGRKNWQQDIIPVQNSNPVWIHVSSLGEFEQARPLIELLKKEQPHLKIILSFFSPSGYEIRKNYALVDAVCYLPWDFKSNARNFIETVQPRLAIFVKYDFWYHYFLILKTKKIPLVVISAIFNRQDVYLKNWSGVLHRCLQMPDYLFVQNQESVKILKEKGINHVMYAPDTRIDRAYQILNEALEKHIPHIDEFKQNNFLVIGGSTYPTEENYLLTLIEKFPEIKIIIAPHDVSAERINNLKKKIHVPYALWSRIPADSSLKNKKVLVIDTIGLLQYLYRYADMALIGGGFDASIHNLLEPATFSIPVIFGPNKHENFHEALSLLKTGGGFLIRHYQDLENITQRMLLDEAFRKEAGKKAGDFIRNHAGGTQIIYNHLMKNFLKP